MSATVQEDDTLAAKFQSELVTILDKHAPAKTVVIKGEVKKPWYNDDIHLARQKHRQRERMYRQSGLEIHKQMLAEQSKQVVSMINCAKREFYQQKLEGANQKDSFKLLDSLLVADQLTPLPQAESNQDLADKFVSYFDSKVKKIREGLDAMDLPDAHPLELDVPAPQLSVFQQQSQQSVQATINKCATKSCALDALPTKLLKAPQVLDAALPVITSVINQSLSSGVVPTIYKSALVTPLLKKTGLDCNDYRNFRPVSNIHFLGKVLEKVVAKQLMQHITEHNIHDDLQSAYRVGCSTETALLKIKSDIDQVLDEGDDVLLVLLDLSAAFDTIDHEILLHRLKHLVGLSGSALSWMRSYLAGRSQTVVIKGAASKPVSPAIGVPQGSVLGPLLFLVYVLPLKALIQRHHIMRHGFADDAQLYDRLPRKDSVARQQVVDRMEGCLAEVRVWMAQNKLKLNDSKTECLVISGKGTRREEFTIQIGDEVIRPKVSVSNLGAVLDRELSMEAQVHKVIKGIYYHLRRIALIRKYLTQSACAKILHATVTSRLDFHNGLLAGLPDKTICRLQVAQNNAARLLRQVGRREHITPVLSSLHWLPVRQRIAYKVLMVIQKTLHTTTAPNYLCEQFTLYQPGRQLRSSSDPWTLAVPRHQRQYGSRSFRTFGARLWNTLPADLRNPLTVPVFKKKLKTFLFRQAYNND